MDVIRLNPIPIRLIHATIRIANIQQLVTKRIELIIEAQNGKYTDTTELKHNTNLILLRSTITLIPDPFYRHPVGNTKQCLTGYRLSIGADPDPVQLSGSVHSNNISY